MLRPRCEDRNKVSAYQLRFRETSGNVESVVLFVVEFEPALEVSQNRECIVTEHIAAIVVGAAPTKLLDVRCARMSMPAGTYSIDQAVDICPDFRVNCLSLGEGVVFLHGAHVAQSYMVAEDAAKIHAPQQR